MLSDDEVSKLLAGTFELPCLHMTLRQNREQNAHEYRGPGEIRQGQAGVLNLRLFDQHSAPAPVAYWPVGELVARDEFYALRAIDMSGREWSGMLLPHASRAIGGGCQVTGRIRRIESTTSRGHERASVIELLIPTQLALPPTTRTHSETRFGDHRTRSFVFDTAVFAAAGFHFTCRAQANRTGIRAFDETAAPPKSAWVRIVEAFQFLLGRVVQPVLVKVAAGADERVMLFSTDLRRSEGVEPPLRLGAGAAADDAWKLFNRYLSYIWTTDAEVFHPQSAAWYPVVSYGGSSLETQALILSVAAEAVLKIVDIEGASLAPELDEDGIAVRNAAEQWFRELEQGGLNKRSRKRLRGLFNPLFRMSAEGRFNRLTQLGRVSPELVENWRALRHPSAHGGQGQLIEPTAMLRACWSVLELLYQLVFYAVGYEGRCVGYGERNWPDRVYPPKAQSTLRR